MAPHFLELITQVRSHRYHRYLAAVSDSNSQPRMQPRSELGRARATRLGNQGPQPRTPVLLISPVHIVHEASETAFPLFKHWERFSARTISVWRLQCPSNARHHLRMEHVQFKESCISRVQELEIVAFYVQLSIVETEDMVSGRRAPAYTSPLGIRHLYVKTKKAILVSVSGCSSPNLVLLVSPSPLPAASQPPSTGPDYLVPLDCREPLQAREAKRVLYIFVERT